MIDIRDKKILVTGSAGFLGTHVVQKLKSRGVPEKSILTPYSSDFDLRLFKDCEAVVRGQNIVIHLAGVTGGIEFHKINPGKVFYENLIMGAQLMEVARETNIEKMVVIGSVAEYPGTLARSEVQCSSKALIPAP